MIEYLCKLFAVLSDEKITQIFCFFDDFCIEFVPFWYKKK